MKGSRKVDYFGYKCSTKLIYARQHARGITCNQGYISCRVLDTAVWSAICKILLQPETLIAGLEANLRGERNEQIRQQVEYLESQLEHKKVEDDRLFRAYMKDAFDENEFKERRDLIRAESEYLRLELERLRPMQISQEQFEERKAELLAMSEELHRNGQLQNPPFELKRRILKMTVEAVHVNQREGTFTLTGSLNPSIQFLKSPLESVSG